MTKKRISRILFRRSLATALLLAVLAKGAPALASDGTGTAYIVKYKESAIQLMEERNKLPFDVVDVFELERLRNAGALEWYEEDGEGILLEEDPTAGPEQDPAEGPEVPPYSQTYQWNLDLIGAAAAFQENALGQRVRVGVLDSGINPHEDLAARLRPGRNYIEGGDPEDSSDSYGHGTRVAGLIAAAGPDGYIGPAPEAELIPLKITDGKTFKVSALCAAIYGAIDDYRCEVLNLSLGVTKEYEALREAIAYAEARGVAVAAAAGNSGNTALYYPANYASVVGVGSVDREGNWYSRSNHNESVYVTAPGVNVRCPDYRGGYTLCTGTSFAVPQVSGAMAVLLGLNRSLTPGKLRELLAQSAGDRGPEGYDTYYGHGILKISGCLTALAEGDALETACTLLPESGPASELRNNTDEDLDCVYLLAEYAESGKLLRISLFPLTVPARGTAEIQPPDVEKRCGQFVLSKEGMVPLAAARKT